MEDGGDYGAGDGGKSGEDEAVKTVPFKIGNTSWDGSVVDAVCRWLPTLGSTYHKYGKVLGGEAYEYPNLLLRATTTKYICKHMQTAQEQTLPFAVMVLAGSAGANPNRALLLTRHETRRVYLLCSLT